MTIVLPVSTVPGHSLSCCIERIFEAIIEGVPLVSCPSWSDEDKLTFALPIASWIDLVGAAGVKGTF